MIPREKRYLKKLSDSGYGYDKEEKMSEDIDNIIEKNKIDILKEEDPKGYPSLGYDFKMENSKRKKLKAAEEKSKGKEKTARRERIIITILIVTLIYILGISLFIMFYTKNINTKMDEIITKNPSNQTITNVKQKAKYTQATKDIVLDINDVVIKDGTITIQYTLKNSGNSIQPLFEKSSLINNNNNNLEGIEKYNNMQSKTLRSNEATEGFLTFSSKDKGLGGFYVYKLPILTVDGTIEMNIEFRI